MPNLTHPLLSSEQAIASRFLRGRCTKKAAIVAVQSDLRGLGETRIAVIRQLEV
jgi:hypothetical protein